MNDDFAPDYFEILNVFKSRNTPSPPMPWLAWALVNILSLCAIYAVDSAVSDTDGHAVLLLAVFFVLGPALVAGFLDGRGRTWGALTLSGWAFLLVSFIALTHTDEWQRDCGLGQGFAMYFAAMAAAIYPVVMVAAFGLGRLGQRLLSRRSSTH